MLAPVSACLLPLVAVLLGFSSRPDERLPSPQRIPTSEKFPVVPGGAGDKDAGAGVLPPRQRIFGIGVGFEKSGTLQGVPLSLVLPGAPAFRAGLTTGCVVAEINGETTIGRAGDDCARMIRDSTSSRVILRYFDSTLKEHVITLEKEWLEVP